MPRALSGGRTLGSKFVSWLNRSVRGDSKSYRSPSVIVRVGRTFQASSTKSERYSFSSARKGVDDTEPASDVGEPAVPSRKAASAFPPVVLVAGSGPWV